VSYTAENTGGVEGTQTLTLDAGALGTNSTSVTLGGGESANLTLSVKTEAGEAGEYTAAVSSANDSDTANVAVEAPASSSLTALDIVGQATDATLTKGTDGNVSVVVENVGDQTASFDVTLDIGTAVSQTQPTGSLSSGAAETVTFTGVTGGLSADTYAVTVSTTDDSVSGILSVQAPAQSVLSNLVVAGQGTNATIAEGDSEDVALVVENVGGQTGSFGVTLDIGTAVSQTQSTSQLSSGAGEVVTFPGVRGGLPPGEYSVDVSTADDTTSGSLSVKTAESFLFGLNIDVQGSQESDATISVGESIDISVIVQNVGGAAGSFEATLSIGNQTYTQQTSELSNGQNEIVTFTGVAGGLAPGDYSVTALTTDDAASGSLTVEDVAASSLSNLDITGQDTTATLPVGEAEACNVSVTGTDVSDQNSCLMSWH